MYDSLNKNSELLAYIIFTTLHIFPICNTPTVRFARIQMKIAFLSQMLYWTVIWKLKMYSVYDLDGDSVYVLKSTIYNNNENISTKIGTRILTVISFHFEKSVLARWKALYFLGKNNSSFNCFRFNFRFQLVQRRPIIQFLKTLLIDWITQIKTEQMWLLDLRLGNAKPVRLALNCFRLINRITSFQNQFFLFFRKPKTQCKK